MSQLLSHLRCLQPMVLPTLPNTGIRQKMQIPIQCFNYLTNGRFHGKFEGFQPQQSSFSTIA